jgi:hypothetical protein
LTMNTWLTRATGRRAAQSHGPWPAVGGGQTAHGPGPRPAQPGYGYALQTSLP